MPVSACAHSQKEMIHLLLENGANPSIMNDSSQTPYGSSSKSIRDYIRIYAGNSLVLDFHGSYSLR